MKGRIHKQPKCIFCGRYLWTNLVKKVYVCKNINCDIRYIPQYDFEGRGL